MQCSKLLEDLECEVLSMVLCTIVRNISIMYRERRKVIITHLTLCETRRTSLSGVVIC